MTVHVTAEEHRVMLAVEGGALYGPEFIGVAEVWVSYRIYERDQHWRVQSVALKTDQLATVRTWSGRNADIVGNLPGWLRDRVLKHKPVTTLGEHR